MPVSIPFTPPHVSVNRVQIVDLPGLALDDEVRGRQAHDLFSSRALVDQARQWAGPLRLPDRYRKDTRWTQLETSHFLADCLHSPDRSARAAAEAITRRLGRNLGYILLTLHRGDPINQQARSDWTSTDWDRWRSVRQIWLGGGLSCGLLGDHILDQARNLLQETGYGDQLQINASSWGDRMALVGAARYLPADTRQAICLDLGHSMIKRACLRLVSGALSRGRFYPPLEVDWDEIGVPSRPERWREANGERVLAFVAETITRLLWECQSDGLRPGQDIMLSVAAYVQEGRLLGNGLYAQISRLGNDARQLIAEAVSLRTDQQVRVHLIHDGTAAAALHAGKPHTAVILAGTALGVGFPPDSDAGLRPTARVRP